MKKALNWTYFLVLMAVLSACEKPNLSDEQPKRKGYRVSLHIEDVAQSYAGAKARALVDIDEVCSCLNAAVYQDGEKKASINQNKSDKSFGNLSLELPEGQYSLVVIGHNGSKNASMAHADKVKFDGKVTETFLYNGTIKVTGDMQQSITLTRCVAKVEFHFVDPIPENVTHLRFSYTGGSSTLDATSGFGCVDSRQTEVRSIPAEAHHAASSYAIYTFPKAQEGKIKVIMKALDINEKTLAEQTFGSLKIVRNGINHIPNLSFKPNGGTTARGIKVKADDSWATSFETEDW